MSHPIENILRTTMEQLKLIADVNTVVGAPVMTADSTIVVPVSKISLGFVSGGGEYCGGESAVRRSGRTLDSESAPGEYPFIGTSVVGVCMQPMAFLTVQDGHVAVLPAKSDCTADRIVDHVPQLLMAAERLLERLCKKEEGEGER